MDVEMSEKLFAELDRIRDMQLAIAKDHVNMEMLSADGISFEHFSSERVPDPAEPLGGPEATAAQAAAVMAAPSEEQIKRHAERVAHKQAQIRELMDRIEQISDAVANLHDLSSSAEKPLKEPQALESHASG